MDDTAIRGQLLALEAENRRLWNALDECMRDQTKSDKKTEKLEKRLAVLEEWLAIRDGNPHLKPPAERSVG